MKIPQIGVGLPHFGPHASPQTIVAVAQAAEALGYASAWCFERWLLPTTAEGQNPYGLPEESAWIYDPLETLTWVAAHTQKLRLGTCVLNALFQPPVLLARRLATLDRLCGGRLLVGIGQGWMPEEYAVANVPPSRRGAGFEEYLAALRACWGADPVAYNGRRYPIPRAKIGPKPLNGTVPLLIGGNAEAAVKRAARLGDGFAEVFQDWELLAAQLAWYRGAGGEGHVVLRVNPQEIGVETPSAPFTGKAAAVLNDLRRAAELGVDEVIWDLNFTQRAPQGQIAALQELAAIK